MIIMGVNHDTYTPDMTVVSNSACIAHCLGPIAHVLHSNWGIA